MYNTMIQYFYTLQNNHNKSSYHVTIKFITILLTIFPRLHITFLWLIYYVTGIFSLLLSLTYFICVSSASPQQTSICSLCLWLCFCFVMFLICFLDSTCKWKSYVICLLWLISCEIKSSMFILVLSMLSQMSRFHSFSWLVIFYIFFIHLSINGHLGCFHILAIVNSATMNIRVHISFQIGAFVLFR